ncbi:Junction plakoglobin [Schistosoma japonicum]|uniref:Junction plakoglobin n=1 Tax=Schistosoma japonicum TaxID=6182 RepID=A0A4Z2CTE9_SCHJA|nr:Junction plakoglobin [Schistosoma japonicum]
MSLSLNMALLSEGKLKMDFESSYDSSGSESSSLYNSDSGVSVTTPASCNTWPAFDFEHPDDSKYLYCDLISFYETHSAPAIQAVQCLSNVDIDIVLNASTYLFHLCRGGYASFIARICPDVFDNVKIPVFCPSTSKYVDVLHCISGIINYLSLCPDGQVTIIHNGGLDVINGLLLFPFESVLYFCVTAVHNILLSHKSAKGSIHRTCITSRLINLLNYSVEYVESNTPSTFMPSANTRKDINPKFLAVLCDCLYILAYRSESTKRAFKEQGGLSSLLKVIMVSTYEKVLWTATRLLRVLSAWIPVKYEIIAQDPHLNFFTYCLECHSSRVIANALWTMRNLSDIAVDKISLDVSVNVVKQLLSRLKFSAYGDSCATYYSGINRGDTPVSRCILGALANLTCRNNAAKSYVVRHNGIDLILQILYTEISEQKNYYHTFCDNLSQSMSSLTIQCKNEDDNSNICKKLSGKIFNNNKIISNDHMTKYPAMAATPTSSSSSSVAGISVNGNECNHASLLLIFPKLLASTGSVSMKSYLNYSSHNSSDKSKLFLDVSALNATLDLIEAGIRCLSHLTVGHTELSDVFNYFVHRRFASKLIISMGTIYLPSLLSFPFDQHINLCRDKDISNNNNNNVWELDCLTQILQLTKTWAVLVRNLCVNFNSIELTSTMKVNPYEKSVNHTSHDYLSADRITNNLWPKHLRSQLRHGVHKLVQSLRHLMNSLPRDSQPKELKPTMEFIHNVSIALFSLSNNNGNFNSNTINNYQSQ